MTETTKSTKTKKQKSNPDLAITVLELSNRLDETTITFNKITKRLNELTDVVNKLRGRLGI